MAISKDQILSAIEAITATGQKPTTLTIREYLGTGSLGTINPILKEWREAQAPPTLPPISSSVPVPQPFTDGVLAIIPQLWTVAAETADTIFTAERIAWTAERDGLKTELDEATALEAASAADLEAAQTRIIDTLETSTTQIDYLTATMDQLKTKHAAALDEEIAARLAAGQATAVLQGVNEELKNRIEDLFNLVEESKAATQAAERRNAVTESTLKTTAENLDITRNLLAEQTTARTKAEQAAAVLQATNAQMQTRIDDLQDQNKEFKNVVHALKLEQAAQIKLTNAAEKRAITAEATLAAFQTQAKAQ